MSVRRAASQLLASRSVHVRITPRPANISESREIMRVLQRFGEISMYKYLRFEYHNPAYNSVLAIYRNAAGAQQALDASPIQFALERVVTDPTADTKGPLDGQHTEEHEVVPAASKDGIDEILQPSRLVNGTPIETTQTEQDTESSRPPMPFEPIYATKQAVSKWFKVTVDRSRAVHQDYVERQPYWKQFAPTKSMAQEDLAKVVPHIGLSDVSKRPMNAHRTPVKVLKTMSDYVERAMPSLGHMYEEGGREKKNA